MLVKFEQNCMVGNIQNFELLEKKMVNHFLESVEAILEDVPVTKTAFWCKNINLKTIIFQCFKIYGNPTLLTR